jgi:hypothetical protein
MPTVAIYIRKANLQKYLSMENPSEWINAILANTDDVSKYGSIKQTPVGEAVTVLSETLPSEPEEKPKRSMKEVLPPWLQVVEDEVTQKNKENTRGGEFFREGKQIYYQPEEGEPRLYK